MARILIPTPLRPYTGNQDAVMLAGGTVGELLETLTRSHSELRRHLYTGEGKLRSFVNVYVNDEDIRYLSKESTPVAEQDVVSIVPSIAGGVPLLFTLAPVAGHGVGQAIGVCGLPVAPEQGRRLKAIDCPTAKVNSSGARA